MKMSDVFQNLKSRNEAALVAFYTGGFPDMKSSMDNLQCIADSGADIIEVGIPFSDPVADGPVIQRASQISLQSGMTLPGLFQEIGKRTWNVPLVMMSYLNPLMAYGSEKFFEDAARAGFSGLIVPDLSVTQSTEWRSRAGEAGIDMIFLAAPTSTDERLKAIVEASHGFIYCVSLAGTTGVRDNVSQDASVLIRRIRRFTNKPICVGFGVSRPEHVRLLKSDADGVIVGSRIIQAVEEGEDLAGLIQSLKVATKRETVEGIEK